MTFARKFSAGVVLCLLFITASLAAQVVPTCTSASIAKWRPADVVVGVGGGQWKVFRPCAQVFYDSVSDNIGGFNNGSTFDNTWHLIGADAGSGRVSKVVRFSISPHDPNSVPTPPVVQSTFDSSAGNSTNPQAVIVNNAGNIIVANATPATINVFSPSGSPLNSFPLGKNIDRSLTGADLSADGTVLYYTSGGQNLRALNLSTGAITVVNSLSGAKMYGVRAVPAGGFPVLCGSVACPSGANGNGIAGFVVANLKTVLVLDSAGNFVAQYAISGQNNLQEVALSPLVSDGATGQLSACCTNPLPDTRSNTFWAASPTSGNLYQMSFTQTANAVASYASGSSGVFSIANYAGFGANQPIATEFPDVTFTPQPPTFTSTNGSTYLFAGTDQLKLTAYSGSSFPTGFSTIVSAFATAIQPSSGDSDAALHCTQTIGSPSPNLCTIWELSARDPSTGDTTQFPQFSLMSMAISSPQPPNAPNPSINGNTQFLRNELYDITLGFRSTDPIGKSTFSVYSLNQNNVPNGGCTYSPPVSDGAVFNNPGNITFRFTCTATDTHGNNITPQLKPRITVVQTFPQTGFSPLPFVPGVSGLTGGTCCSNTSTGTVFYRFDPTANTWVINVSFSGFSGTFIATTFDDNHLVEPFDVGFTITK